MVFRGPDATAIASAKLRKGMPSPSASRCIAADAAQTIKPQRAPVDYSHFLCNTGGLDSDSGGLRSRAHRNKTHRVLRRVSAGMLFVGLHRVASHYARALTTPLPADANSDYNRGGP
jgi:hypothetical protein